MISLCVVQRATGQCVIASWRTLHRVHCWVMFVPRPWPLRGKFSNGSTSDFSFSAFVLAPLPSVFSPRRLDGLEPVERHHAQARGMRSAGFQSRRFMKMAGAGSREVSSPNCGQQGGAALLRRPALLNALERGIPIRKLIPQANWHLKKHAGLESRAPITAPFI
jgi:hypothetical protein